ncbi:MAG: dihydrofolate reductase [Bacteriovoracaceae bacterium]
MIISLIAAMGKSRQLGLDNKIPWHVPDDFKQFKARTMGHTLLMGRKTFESIGRPLPGRKTYVLTRNESLKDDPAYKDVEVRSNFLKTILEIRSNKEDHLFIAGGSNIYQLAISSNIIENIILSVIDYDGEADAYLPEWEEDQYQLKEEVAYESNNGAPMWKWQHWLRSVN